jgi:phosphoribosyl-ATP pyrophosphohydrolase
MKILSAAVELLRADEQTYIVKLINEALEIFVADTQKTQKKEEQEIFRSVKFHLLNSFPE